MLELINSYVMFIIVVHIDQAVVCHSLIFQYFGKFLFFVSIIGVNTVGRAVLVLLCRAC